jgi:hypothetical protein
MIPTDVPDAEPAPPMLVIMRIRLYDLNRLMYKIMITDQYCVLKTGLFD